MLSSMTRKNCEHDSQNYGGTMENTYLADNDEMNEITFKETEHKSTDSIPGSEKTLNNNRGCNLNCVSSNQDNIIGAIKMQRKRFSEEQIIKALKSNEAGAKVSDICHELGIAKQTFYRWRKKYHGAEVAQAKHLREPDAENTKSEELSAESDSYEELFSQGLITEGELFDRYIDQVIANEKSGDYASAIVYYDRAIELNPDNTDAQENPEKLTIL